MVGVQSDILHMQKVALCKEQNNIMTAASDYLPICVADDLVLCFLSSEDLMLSLKMYSFILLFCFSQALLLMAASCFLNHKVKKFYTNQVGSPTSSFDQARTLHLYKTLIQHCYYLGCQKTFVFHHLCDVCHICHVSLCILSFIFFLENCSIV